VPPESRKRFKPPAPVPPARVRRCAAIRVLHPVYNKAMACGNFIAGAELDEDRAIRMLLDASNHNGLINEDGEQAVLASIRSGIRNGKTRPRGVPPGPPDDEPAIDDESAEWRSPPYRAHASE
jgi:hypothetical protein